MHIAPDSPVLSSDHILQLGADTHRPPPNAVSALATKLAFLFNFFSTNNTINCNALSNLAAQRLYSFPPFISNIYTINMAYHLSQNLSSSPLERDVFFDALEKPSLQLPLGPTILLARTNRNYYSPSFSTPTPIYIHLLPPATSVVL